MSKIRIDGRTMALSHPTRQAVYETLLERDEMSTVMLQKSTGITRYHLYHHIQLLQKNGLVENHRDEGRARWWRVTERVSLDTNLGNSQSEWSDRLPDAVRELLNSGAEVHVIPIPPTAANQISAKKAVEEIASAFEVELDMAFTFMPNNIVIFGPPRRT